MAAQSFPSAPPSYAYHDSAPILFSAPGSDKDMQDDEPVTPERALRIEAELNSELNWSHRLPNDRQSRLQLALPVVVPQQQPNLTAPFSRAWSPVLAQQDVRIEEFLAFVDHLNVCKAGSPALQAVGLAGTVLGFSPTPIAHTISMCTGLAVGAATYGVARYRIARYVAKANTEYFHPRGLHVCLAKGDALSQICKIPNSAPVLAQLEDDAALTGSGIRDQRLAALQGYIAPIQFDELPAHSQQSTALDRISASLIQRKHVKTAQKEQENKAKLQERALKAQESIEKVNQKAQKELAKSPKKAGKIERERLKDLAKIDEKLGEARKKMGLSASSDGAPSFSDKQEEKGRKLMFIVVRNLEEADLRMEQGQISLDRTPRMQ